MEKAEDKYTSARESILSMDVSWWPIGFWLFIGQLIWEGIMLGLDERVRLSAMELSERLRFIRSELADDVLVSAVIAIAIVDIGRYLVITAGWFKNLVDRNIAAYEEKILDRGRAEGRNQVLENLDEDARKEVERKLRRNGDSMPRQ